MYKYISTYSLTTKYRGEYEDNFYNFMIINLFQIIGYRGLLLSFSWKVTFSLLLMVESTRNFLLINRNTAVLLG